MYKTYFKKVAYTLLLIPLFSSLLTLFVRLFYLCANKYLVIVVLLIAVTLAWFAAKKMLKDKKLVGLIIALSIVSVIYGAVYLGSFNCARCAAPEAGVMQLISNIRAQAELYLNNNNSYVGVCDDSRVIELGNSADKFMRISSSKCFGPITKMFMSSEAVQESHFVCNDSIDEYAAEEYVPSRESYYCVDSTGFGGQVQNSLGSLTKCVAD
ncbi:hypothetical protein H6784_04340 [Candidatus Nomurabacteria bacterium]|nr:hypothetical protein [Candidatus Kaiserbacteria bacterium]MCB9814617.1 hypothetical protein [Candidatus Nomurabacteria bacterium]